MEKKTNYKMEQKNQLQNEREKLVTKWKRKLATKQMEQKNQLQNGTEN